MSVSAASPLAGMGLCRRQNQGGSFCAGRVDGALLPTQQHELLQRGFHQGFGVGSGNEHGGRDGEGAAVELLLAQKIDQGFAAAAALGQGAEAGGDVRGCGIVAVGHEPGQRLAGEAGQQAACLGTGQAAVTDEIVEGGACRAGRAGGEGLGRSHVHSSEGHLMLYPSARSAASSASRAFIRASVSSSRSPSMMACSL